MSAYDYDWSFPAVGGGVLIYLLTAASMRSWKLDGDEQAKKLQREELLRQQEEEEQ